MTATATETVKNDIVKSLNIQNCFYFQSTFNRPNLIYEVKPKYQKTILRDIVEFIKSKNYQEQSGLIYCNFKKDTEKIAKELKE